MTQGSGEGGDRIPVPGSERAPVPGSTRVGDVDPEAPVEATVVLRRAVDEPGAGADLGDANRVAAFAADHGLAVLSVNLAARSVRVAATAAAMSAAFGVSFAEYALPTGDASSSGASPTYRGRTGDVSVPAELAGVVVAVLGLDNRPQANAHFRIGGAVAPHTPIATGAPIVAGPVSTVGGVVAARATGRGYTPVDLAARYGFPTATTGAGQTVAIIELGGGYNESDLTAYFTELGLSVPQVEAVEVDGVGNQPGGDADVEVVLDIEVVGAVANGAALAVYFGPNTTNGFYDTIAAAVNDGARTPSVISISWGAAEPNWTAQSMDAYDALFADAAAAGISVYVACGDNGASDGVSDGGLHVDFPASSPWVVGCGGTTIGTDTTDETVWNGLSTGDGATGGGVSAHFPLPAYQASGQVPASPDGTPGRGVPDIAAVADPATGYVIHVNGSDIIVGGTSAVAPLWAGLTALVNATGGVRVGAPHQRLYADPSALRDIVSGDNAGYSAGPGWDACTGLGVPDGDATVAALTPPPPPGE
jgi:kumamolisin